MPVRHDVVSMTAGWRLAESYKLLPTTHSTAPHNMYNQVVTT